MALASLALSGQGSSYDGGADDALSCCTGGSVSIAVSGGSTRAAVYSDRWRRLAPLVKSGGRVCAGRTFDVLGSATTSGEAVPRCP